MIVPLALEPEWESVWNAAKSWRPPQAPALVIAPHPDDESLAAAGLILTLISIEVPVQVIAVTDGERAYGNQPDANLAEVRRAEQTAALHQLGIKSSHIVRFGLTDSNVANEQKSLLKQLLPLVSKDTHVLAPWTGDFHPDHEACGRVAQKVARLTGAALTFYFFWTWHRGIPSLVQGLPLRSLPLSPLQQQAKHAAIGQHRSQLMHLSGEPILPEHLLWPTRRSTEIFLPA
jgi:LmbE family N-acetylglucosaminyl deacetylase